MALACEAVFDLPKPSFFEMWNKKRRESRDRPTKKQVVYESPPELAQQAPRRSKRKIGEPSASLGVAREVPDPEKQSVPVPLVPAVLAKIPEIDPFKGRLDLGLTSGDESPVPPSVIQASSELAVPSASDVQMPLIDLDKIIFGIENYAFSESDEDTGFLTAYTPH